MASHRKGMNIKYKKVTNNKAHAKIWIKTLREQNIYSTTDIPDNILEDRE